MIAHRTNHIQTLWSEMVNNAAVRIISTNWFLCRQYIVGLNNMTTGREVQPVSDRGVGLVV